MRRAGICFRIRGHRGPPAAAFQMLIHLQAHPTQQARALYDYTRQTDEELSFTEEAILDVFDTSDPDWILVGHEHEYGFVPSNYIEISEAGAEEEAPPTPARPIPARDPSEESDHFHEAPESPPASTPAAAIAGVLQQHQHQQRRDSEPAAELPPPQPPRPQPQFTPEASDEEEIQSPALPARPQSVAMQPSSPPPRPRAVSSLAIPRARSGPVESPPFNRASFAPGDQGGFHLYNVNEMVSVMGKRKKMPTTLGINFATGTITIAPAKVGDGPQQEWAASKMTHHSIEGKHVFLELVKPSRSIDIHAGAKDTAKEINTSLIEMSGLARAEGLKEAWAAASGLEEKKKGQVLYDFMAQGEDEVTVASDDEVIILDDTKSEEWWQVRRLKNGKEGVVPSSYIEVIGTIAVSSRRNDGLPAVEQNRPEVGPGVPLPDRGSSLNLRADNNAAKEQISRRESRPVESRPVDAGPPKNKSSKCTLLCRSTLC